MPYSATASPRIRQARPKVATAVASALRVGLELRRALRHERVALPDEAVAVALDRDDDLAALTERIGHRARVADVHLGRAHGVRRALDAAGDDLPAELVALAGLRRAQLAGDALRARRAEGRVDERAGQQ